MRLNLGVELAILQENIVVKYFGHALGLKHEHQHSDFWDVVKEYMDTERMSAKRVASDFKDQLAGTYTASREHQLSEYDHKSIMHYKYVCSSDRSLTHRRCL